MPPPPPGTISIHLLLQLLPPADGQRGIKQLLLCLGPQHHVGLCDGTSQGVQEDILLVPGEGGGQGMRHLCSALGLDHPSHIIRATAQVRITASQAL